LLINRSYTLNKTFKRLPVIPRSPEEVNLQSKKLREEEVEEVEEE
jgi:hypothetical protein